MTPLPQKTHRRKVKRTRKSDSFKVYAPNAEKTYRKTHLAKALISGSHRDIIRTLSRVRGKSKIMMLLAFFSAHRFVRLAALENIAEKRELVAEAACFAPHEEVRLASLALLNGFNEELAKAACFSRFKKTRLKAVGMLKKDKNALMKVSSESKYSDSKKLALREISTNKEILIKLASEAKSRTVRKKAVEMLGFKEWALKRVLFSDAPKNTRRYVLKRLSKFSDAVKDERVLKEIAMESPDEDGRFVAIGKLSSKSGALLEIIEKSRKRDSRSTALMLLSDSVEDAKDHKVLETVAIKSPYPDCREAALEKLQQKPDSLKKVAGTSKYRDSRGGALELLLEDGHSHVAELYKSAKHADVRKKAKEVLSEPKNLGKHLADMLR